MKKRIWELDALRGVCILGMVLVHFLYDLTMLGKLTLPGIFFLLKDWGGVLFVVLSGICVTLGSHSLRRGICLLLCGGICTAVTWGLTVLGLADKSLTIYFGILHCLGTCMLLWPLFRKLPARALAVFGIVFVLLGLYLNRSVYAATALLIPLGIQYPGFASSDYFPLLPYLGFFLIGAAAGTRLYPNRLTLFPRIRETAPVIRFFCLAGRHSLWIYLLHQPILLAVTVFISSVTVS